MNENYFYEVIKRGYLLDEETFSLTNDNKSIMIINNGKVKSIISLKKPDKLSESQYLVIANKETGEKFRFNPFERVTGLNNGKFVEFPVGFYKVTHTIPIPENLSEYFKLPIYRESKSSVNIK